MIKVGLIGAGKMGISHLSILGAHADVEVAGVADSSRIVLDVLKKFSKFPCFDDYTQMMKHTDLDAVFVAVPTKYHASMIRTLLEQNKHVFAEKPFCLSAEEGKGLVQLAKEKNLVNQVGYHNKFLGTFNEVKRLIDSGYLGDILHFTGESYGPVVTRKKGDSWRSKPMEGGGCLMDYASHVIDLINFILGPITKVTGAITKSFYSKDVEDAVYSLLQLTNGVSGVLQVNWSDETFRKMTTSITILGTKGKIMCDANELKVYFKSEQCPTGYTKGWNVKYLTDMTPPVNFYLRGEEYSSQVDYFIKAVERKVPNNINTFESAWLTDNVISMIRKSASK